MPLTFGKQSAASDSSDAISINVYGIWQLDAETTGMWTNSRLKPLRRDYLH